MSKISVSLEDGMVAIRAEADGKSPRSSLVPIIKVGLSLRFRHFRYPLFCIP
jgi:hypothetical protein